MSQLHKRRKQAERKGVYPYKNEQGGWDIHVDKEWLLGPRELNWPKRRAINLAYQISVSKPHKIEITYGEAVDLCPCKDRPAPECEEQWGPQCDMGNNPAFVRVYPAKLDGWI
jgi:hypothetical protein